MLRMRFNTLGIQVCSGANQWAESYLSFEFAGVGRLAFLDTTASHRWAQAAAESEILLDPNAIATLSTVE